jgi:hypothetical protein
MAARKIPVGNPIKAAGKAGKWWADKAYGNEKPSFPKPNYPKLPDIDISKVAKGTKKKKPKPAGPPRFPSPHGQATTRPGKLSGGDRITEDDPRWKGKK